MANTSSPKVVIMGKGENNEIYNIIKTVETSSIPSDLLYYVFVTLEDGNRYKVNKNMFGNEINYKNLEKQIAGLNFSSPITLLEIVLDLNKVHSEIEKKTEEFLSQYFT